MTTEQRQEQPREENASTEQRREESTTGEPGEDERLRESEDGVEASDVADHLSDVPAGSGCTEIWEHLSEEREDDD